MNKILLLCFFIYTFPALAQTTIKWPDNKKSAIVLTYDDAIQSQLNIALPQLNKHKLKGTFFLDGRLSEKDFIPWREASKRGHELANHSLYHPCSAKSYPADPRFTTETYDVPGMLKEIGMMNKLLYGIDGPKTRTFAFPCTQSIVGGVDYTADLKRSGLIKYARSGGNNTAIITDFTKLDYLKVPSWGIADNTTADELINFVQNVQKQGGLGVLMFHGVGGDYLKVSAEAHEKLVRYLADYKKEIWVGTFQEVLDYMAKQAK